MKAPTLVKPSPVLPSERFSRTPSGTITPVTTPGSLVGKSTLVRPSLGSSKPSPIAKTDNGSGSGTIASFSAPPAGKRMTAQGSNGSAKKSEESATDKSKTKKEEQDFSDIANAYRRAHESEKAKDDKSNPYLIGGVFNREQARKDEKLIYAFENDQLGTQALIDGAKKPKNPKEAATDDKEEEPSSVTTARGRLKDLVRVEATSQIVGLEGDEPEVVDAKDAIIRGKVKDPKAIDRLVDKVGNKGVDKAFGEAPKVDVAGLTRIGDTLKKRGKLKEARDYYNQAIDAVKNGGTNSAGYRLGIIADVQAGIRPASDLERVVKPGSGAKVGTPAAGSAGGKGAGSGNGNGVANAGNTFDKGPGIGQRITDGVSLGKGTGSGNATAGTGSAAAGSNNTANTGSQNAAQNTVGAGVAKKVETGATNVAATPVDNTTSTTENNNTNSNVATTDQAAANTTTSNVTTNPDEIVLASPGNDSSSGHYQSTDGNTGVDVTYNADGTYTATVTKVTRDENGNVESTETTTETGTWAEGTDGERHHTANSSTTSTSSNGQSTEGGQSSADEDKDGDGDKDDDDKDDDDEDTSEDTTTTESSDTDTTESADTATSSEAGTPNPEAPDRGSYAGRLADKTGGHLGGNEKRQQGKAIGLRKNGNGAGTPTPDSNTSSGVLLTPEEQKAFNNHIGMKRGGGVTTPTGEESSGLVVTERDLKDLAARRGSLVNPVPENGGKSGGGMSFGKKGFAPGGGIPVPTPKGKTAATSSAAAILNGAVQVSPTSSVTSGAAVHVNTEQVRSSVQH